MGTALDVHVDGDNRWPELLAGGLIVGNRTGIAALAEGTVRGQPTVTVRIALSDGQTVLARTTLALLLTARDAFVARHGDPRR